MKRKIINFLKFLLFLGLGIGILYIVYWNQNAAFQEDCAQRGIAEADCSLWRKVLGDFASVNYFWILLVLLGFILSNISRAIRWRMLIRPLGYKPRLRNAFLSIAIGYFANLGLPRLGEIVRAGTLAQYEKIKAEKVMGTIVVDRVIDVMSILLVTGLALALEFDTIMAFFREEADIGSRINSGGQLLAILAGVGLLGLLLLWAFRRALMRTKLFRKIVDILRGFWEGVNSVRQLDRPWLFIVHSVNIWLMYFLMTYLCFFAFTPTRELSPLAALMVFVFGGWGVVVPSPGGMGTYHFLAKTALEMYGVSGDNAFSWANIAFFSIQLGCNVTLGIIALIVLPVINRDYHPQNVLAWNPASQNAPKEAYESDRYDPEQN